MSGECKAELALIVSGLTEVLREVDGSCVLKWRNRLVFKGLVALSASLALSVHCRRVADCTVIAGNRSGLSGFREECSALERKRLRVFPSYGSGMLSLSGMLGLSLLRFVRSE